MLLLNYHSNIWTPIIQDNKTRAELTENNKDKKTRALTEKSSGKFYCPDNLFVRTKRHLPTSRILPYYFKHAYVQNWDLSNLGEVNIHIVVNLED